MSNFLQIDGWWGGGKSVLRTLLDGHPDVFCSPIHDFSHCAFIDQNNDWDWVTTKHVEILRKALARTQYYMFEKTYWDGFRTISFSSDVSLKFPYPFNYYNHDRYFIRTLMEEETWSIERIIELIYESLWLDYVKDSYRKAPKWYATMSNPHFIDYYKRFPEILPHGKSIQVRRGVENIIATRSNRKPKPEDFKTKTFFCDSFDKRIQEGEVEKILTFYDKYDALVNQHPKQFMVVDFDDLLSNTSSAMKKTAEFLEIPFDSCLTKATFFKKEIVHNGKKFIGQENDNIEQLLTANERMIIRQRISDFNK